MKRRDFLRLVAAVLLGRAAVPSAIAASNQFANRPELWDAHVRDYLFKMKNFDEPCKGDVYLEAPMVGILESCVGRLNRLQATVGYGNFHLLDINEGLKIARNYPQVGKFSSGELDLLEMIFYEKAAVYGFYGEKPLDGFADRIRKRDVIKVSRTGHYLFKGTPVNMYQKLSRDLGKKAVLTSGVRGVPKQCLLFLKKAVQSKGNLSLASRSLAPPGYSYHGVGDFDVGQVGFGAANFTERFTTTSVYRRLRDLGYVDIRYRQNNRLGVRFEPWHIKVSA